MTLTEISRYFHLNETIQKNREALKFLRERAEPAAPSLNGMPHASGVKDSTGRLAVEIADMDARITYLEEQAEQERDKAVAFCATIQDARLYLIFRLRFVRCLTWAEVADLLGDYYTEEGVCRMAYNYLAKTEKEKPTAQSARPTIEPQHLQTARKPARLHTGQAFSLPQTGDEQAKTPAPPGIRRKALCSFSGVKYTKNNKVDI